MRIIISILLLFTIAGLSSCKKETPIAKVGETNVDIIFTSPSVNETFNGSVEVSIEARIDANAMMSGYRITLTDANSGDVIHTIDDLYEQTQYIVHYHWYPEVSTITPVEIKIEALESSMLTLKENTMQVTCNP